jgi:hypothetical protein
METRMKKTTEPPFWGGSQALDSSSFPSFALGYLEAEDKHSNEFAPLSPMTDPSPPFHTVKMTGGLHFDSAEMPSFSQLHQKILTLTYDH